MQKTQAGHSWPFGPLTMPGGRSSLSSFILSPFSGSSLVDSFFSVMFSDGSTLGGTADVRSTGLLLVSLTDLVFLVVLVEEEEVVEAAAGCS